MPSPPSALPNIATPYARGREIDDPSADRGTVSAISRVCGSVDSVPPETFEPSGAYTPASPNRPSITTARLHGDSTSMFVPGIAATGEPSPAPR